MPDIDDQRYTRASPPARRRRLRRDQTDAERVLWHRLRSRQADGFKFRRQHAVGFYILDFFCAEAMLGVELDGGQHLEADGVRRDRVRAEYLRNFGVRLIRFSDRDVLTDTDPVVEAILGALTPPSPTS